MEAITFVIHLNGYFLIVSIWIYQRRQESTIDTYDDIGTIEHSNRRINLTTYESPPQHQRNSCGLIICVHVL